MGGRRQKATSQGSEDQDSEHLEKKANGKSTFGGWFGGRSKSSGDDDPSNNSNSENQEEKKAEDGSMSGVDIDDDAETDTGNTASTKVVCETYPDGDNEYHEVIRNQNWDLLDILLKEYDYKKYAKPKEKKGPPPRKLRVVKYLPDMSRFKKEEEEEVPRSPLYGLDALGRAPLHLCCISPCPDRQLMRLLFCGRDLASVADETGSLPIHLAITHERSVEVVDKLIRGYYQGSWQFDGTGKTPLMWAVEMTRKQLKEDDNPVPNGVFWGVPTNAKEKEWQEQYRTKWKLIEFMLENRIVRRKKLMPKEFTLIVQALNLSATPKVVSLFLDLGGKAMRVEKLAGPSLSLCIARQYPLELLEKLVDACPMDYPKTYKDNAGRGVVSSHYRVGCVAHQDESDDRRESFRMTMQSLANAVTGLQEKPTPSKAYNDWWEKMKFLLNLWGSHSFEDDASHDDFDMDDLLLHNALSNSDVPPSLVRLLASMRPDATDLEHPRSNALPLHLACRVWRYRPFPIRRGAKEISMDKVVLQLMEGDHSRTRKRYRDRLPLHHAVASGKHWPFVKPLVVYDRKSLQVRDPTTKLYPFQLAATHSFIYDFEALASQSFLPAEWGKMSQEKKDKKSLQVEDHYNLRLLDVVYALLRNCPDAIDHNMVAKAEAERRAAGPKRKLVMEGLEATQEVALTTQIKMIRALFGLGNVSGHFIGWAYENTRRGWKTHRSNFGVLKEAIMDGLIPPSMDSWWRKLKYWIWQDCPWESPAIPRRDEFLLHAAICSANTTPWIVDLLLECFPRSASIPLPNSDGCYPLHIACVTDRYVPLSFEFPNKRTIIEMISKAFPDAILRKWKRRLPLHHAIMQGKDWDEIKYVSDEEPIALAMPDPKVGFFPFQMMALSRPYSAKQRQRFERKAEKAVGKAQWRQLPAHERVVHVGEVLEQHEVTTTGCIWELLKRNPDLVVLPVAEAESPGISNSSSGSIDMLQESNSGSNWSKKSLSGDLSNASLHLLEEVYNDGKINEQRRASMASNVKANAKLSDSMDESISDPFLNNSYRVAPLPPRPRKRDPSNGSSRSQMQYSSSELPPIQQDQATLKSTGPSNKSNGKERNSSVDAQTQRQPVGDSEPEKLQAVPRSDPRSLTAKKGGKGGERRILDGSSSKASLSSEGDRMPEPEAAVNSKFSQMNPSALGPYDHAGLCSERRKDILLIRNAAACVLWKNETIQPGSLKNSEKRKYWLKVLQHMGEEVDIGDIHSLRHENEQTFIAAMDIDGTTVLIDEDPSYTWIVCGQEAASAVENYDIEAAMVVTSSLLDNETESWLEAFQQAKYRDGFTGKNNSHRILDWILGMTEDKSSYQQQKKFMISRKMLRDAFAYGTRNTTNTIAELIIEKSTRRLWFDVASQKLNVRFAGRKMPMTRLYIANRLRFERTRAALQRKQKEEKFFKRLKKKQRHAKRKHKDGSDDTISRNGTANSSVPGHLARIHQPKEVVDDDAYSLHNGDLFEAVSGPPEEKPLLAAALRAKKQIDREKRSKPHHHLIDMNQPVAIPDDDTVSLGERDLFEEPSGPPPAKPLLAAARKAKAQAEASAGSHLSEFNQPKTIPEDDSMSLGEQDIFDEPQGPPPRKPLLAAAHKAKKQSQASTGLHLNNMNQPKTIPEDDVVSLGEHDLFDEPRGALPEKPLLAAAKKAKQQADATKGSHLSTLHQPKTIQEDDMLSLGEQELFEEPRGPPPAKPLVAAAKKAKQQTEAASGSHLGQMNQPRSQVDDDAVSLGEKELFDEPRGPPPEKPLLAAALKAKKQQEGDAGMHLMKLHQPMNIEDDEDSIGSDGLFDPPRGPPPKKPLLAAALKAKQQSLDKGSKENEVNRSGKQERQSRSEKLSTPSHLANAHQPKQEIEDDDQSLIIDHVFDPPKPPPPAKPLLAAALKAKEQRDKGAMLSPGRNKSILKGPKYGGNPTAVVPPNFDDSLDMNEITSPRSKTKAFSPQKDPNRKAVPMSAKLIRMNSVQKFQVKSPESSKKGKKRSSQSRRRSSTTSSKNESEQSTSPTSNQRTSRRRHSSNEGGKPEQGSLKKGSGRNRRRSTPTLSPTKEDQSEGKESPRKKRSSFMSLLGRKEQKGQS